MGRWSAALVQDQSKLAELCASFVKNLFLCPDSPPTSAPNKPVPSLCSFISYALWRTRLHSRVCITALMLLQRLKARFPSARGSSGYRLFFSAFMIASKVVCDDTYSNKSWAIVGQGLFSLREVNQMEREMCSYLDWELSFDPEVLESFEEKVCQEFLNSGNIGDTSKITVIPKPSAPANPTSSTTNGSEQNSRSGSSISRCVDTALRCIGFRPRGALSNSTRNQPHGPTSRSSWASWKRPKRRRPDPERPRSDANIYGGSFTNVEGDVNPVTNIYVNVHNNNEPGPPPLARTQSLESDSRPNYTPPRTRTTSQTSYIPKVSPTPIPVPPPTFNSPPPQVGYSPPFMTPYPFAPVAFPLLYPVYLLPSRFYMTGTAFMNYAPSFLFVLAGWLCFPSHWPPGVHWG